MRGNSGRTGDGGRSAASESSLGDGDRSASQTASGPGSAELAASTGLSAGSSADSGGEAAGVDDAGPSVVPGVVGSSVGSASSDGDRDASNAALLPIDLADHLMTALRAAGALVPDRDNEPKSYARACDAIRRTLEREGLVHRKAA